MKKKMLATMACLGAFAVYGCGGGGTEAPAEQPAEEPATETETTEAEAGGDLSGTVAISGSTSTEDVVKALADEFTAQNPGVEITYEGIGSSAGVKNAIDGVSDIGTASREIKEEESAEGIDTLVLAHDGIAAIVHPDNEVADISMEQLTQVYAGEITNWSELGGADADIVVVSREDGSGTRSAFEEILGLEESGIVASATIAEGNGNVQTTVAGNPNALGYVSFAYLDDTIKALTIGGAEATPDAVKSGDYALSRPFNMVYFQDQLSDVAQAFLDFVQSEDAVTIIEDNNAIAP